MKICVIDSGCSFEVAQNTECSIKQIDCLDNVPSNWHLLEQCRDHLGHGTAVVSTIIKGITKAEVVILQIFDRDYEIDQEKLYDILQYVDSNIHCDLLHMSFGVISCANITKLENLCASIQHKGTIIVSAYNNEGAISYPAFFNCVIGVDSFHIPYGRKYTYIENSPINIQVNTGVKRVTVDGVPRLFTGSSFSSAYISNIILAQLLRDPSTNIHHYLKKNSSQIKNDKNIIPYPEENRKISKKKRAIVFPFNKEIQTLLNFCDMLPFDIVGVYDGNHSKNVNSIYHVPSSLASKKAFKIKAYASIDWQSDFDLFILGHCSTLSELEKFDYFSDAYNETSFKKIELFSFEKNKNYNNYSLPEIKYEYGWRHFGKLFAISTPVVGVFGTSSSQGKMTAQLLMRKCFLQKGFSVGQLGTEPYSELFGFDAVYPFGFMNSLCLNEEEQTIILNNMLASIDAKGHDIIVCGSQSGTIPYLPINSSYLTNKQMNFAFAVQPDASFLCVNPYDELEYIQRTLHFLNCIPDNKVLGIILFPVDRHSFWGQTKNRQLNPENIEKVKSKLTHFTQLPVFILNQSEIDLLCDEVIAYFS